MRSRYLTINVRSSLLLLLVGSLLLSACGIQSSAKMLSNGRLDSQEVQFLIGPGSRSFALVQMNLGNDVEELTSKCMASKGFTYYPSIASQPDVSNAIYVPAYRSLKIREKYGFVIPTPDLPPQSESPGSLEEQQYVNSLQGSARNRYYDALRGFTNHPKMISFTIMGQKFGQGFQGCGGQALIALYGSMSNAMIATEQPNLVTLEFEQLVQNSPRFNALMHQWSSCMRLAGFKFTTPFAAENYFLNNKYYELHHRFTPAVNAEQIAVAVRDYKCATKMHLSSKIDDVQISEAQTVSNKMVGELVRGMTLDEEAEKRGSKLISEPWHSVS